MGSVANSGAPGPVSYLGIPYAAMDAGTAASVCAERPAGDGFAYVVTPNAQHVVRLHQGDATFREGYAKAWLYLSDSRVVRLLARALHRIDMPIACGSDVTALLFEKHIRPDDPIVVIGGTEELGEALRRRYKLGSMAQHIPPFGLLRDRAALDACIRFVEEHPARYVFLAVGAPQSELLAARIASRGKATGLGLCIGSSLNFLTGIVPRAPKLMQRLALEWLYRFVTNPRVVVRRVVVESVPVLWIALRYRVRGGTLLVDRPAVA